MSSKITVVGSINVDLVIHSDRLPLPGETIRGSRFQVIPGGKGANQAWALLYLFNPLISTLPDLETAFYFSMVTFTTLGFGDVVLTGQWRTLVVVCA